MLPSLLLTANQAPTRRGGPLEQARDSCTLLAQLRVRRAELAAGKLVDLEPLDDLVIAADAAHGIGVDHAFGDAVAAVGRDGHADPVVACGAERPIVHV